LLLRDADVADILLDATQADTATIWSSLLAFQKALQSANEPFRDRLFHRFKYMCDGPYLLLAYCSPTVRLQQNDSVEKMIVSTLKKYSIDDGEMLQASRKSATPRRSDATRRKDPFPRGVA
jgi:hypothetical protein